MTQGPGMPAPAFRSAAPPPARQGGRPAFNAPGSRSAPRTAGGSSFHGGGPTFHGGGSSFHGGGSSFHGGGSTGHGSPGGGHER
jgi:hypothetical protein